jgi:hypothetical protein
MNPTVVALRTAGLLGLSNCFMTLAWYGHLRFKSAPLWLAILASWLLALPEDALQVPANRWGHGTLSSYQLKILREVITLCVFIVFALLGLGEKPEPRHFLAMALILAAVAVTFWR